MLNEKMIIFQSTLPTRGSDVAHTRYGCVNLSHFNPRSPRGGATQAESPLVLATRPINPRSPRERATDNQSTPNSINEIQSTLPTRGSDTGGVAGSALGDKFQSTLPTRGSDRLSPRRTCSGCYFNPRSPRGGATILLPRLIFRKNHFNPRSPRGGATFAPRRTD